MTLAAPLLDRMPASPVPPGRFYPPEVPAFAHEPRPDRFTIGPVPGRGMGVIALQPLAAGAIAFAFSGVVVPAITLRSLQLAPGRHVHDEWFMGFVLHSCDPSLEVDMTTRIFTCRRAIAAGEACTMDYMSTETTLFRGFACSCGAARCRGWLGPRP